MNKKWPYILSAIAGSTLLGAMGTSVAAEGPTSGDLLRDADPAEVSQDFSAMSEEAREPRLPKSKRARNRPVAVDMEKLRADRFNLKLFDDAAFVAERDRVVEHGAADSVWVGHLQGEPASEVVLAVRDGAMAGTVKRENGDLYEIAYRGDGLYRVRQLDPGNIPSHPHPVAVGTKPQGATTQSAPSTSPSTTSTTSSTTTIIDLMVVYTPKARANAKGAAGMKAKIDNAVAAANQAYLNSKIDMRLRLVYSAEVPYTETGNMMTTLYDLQRTKDGKMDIVHQWRNQYGADQVALISADANYCGLGFQMTSLSYPMAPYAFAVAHDDSRYACLSNQTLAHELGHNQGNAHDRANSSTPGIFSYSYGYRLCQSSGFRTIMAYPCAGANLISYFANPSLTVNGRVIGVDPDLNPATSAADAWSMTKARTKVASWRPTMATSGSGTVAAAPNAPANLAASPVASDRISLEWNDTSGDEAGFRIERSLDGTEWTEIANLPPDTQRFTHTGLAPATRYLYRVMAYNGVGGSDSTNLAAAATLAPDPRGGQDTLPPDIRIRTPRDGASIGDLVGIVATGRDDTGIASLKLYVDGRLKAATHANVLTYRWDARGIAPGPHRIEVVAADAAGNTGRDSIQVNK